MVHRREVGGEVLVFGNQGALWGNAMTWFDHETGSVWSQPLGEAIAGPLKGERLELMAVQLAEWGTWLKDHPGTMALDAPASQGGFHLPTMSIVVDFGIEVGVYPISLLTKLGSAHDVIAGVPIAVVVDGEEEGRWKVFHSEPGGQSVRLVVEKGVLKDVNTGSTFDMATGRGLSGPLEGVILDQLPGFTAFESDARTFWPDARYWDGQS